MLGCEFLNFWTANIYEFTEQYTILFQVLGELCMVSFAFNVDQTLIVTTVVVTKTDGACVVVQK
jgi:hypothetical protein